jgi:hypothetical protein
MWRLLCASVFVVLIFNSCSLFDQEETIPGILIISSVEVIEDNPNFETCFGHKIRNIEVYVNGITQGIYPINAPIPIFEEGLVDIEIFPLVYASGSSQNIEPHLFLQKESFSLDINFGEVVERDVVFEYQPNTVFRLTEFFGLGNQFNIDIDDDEENTLTVVMDDYCQDNQVGQFVLDTATNLAIVTTPSLLENLTSDQAYLELDYYSELDMTISFAILQQNSTNLEIQDLYYIKPKLEWNKLYINMTDFIRQSNGIKFQMYLSASLPLADEDGNTVYLGKAYLDNIRILTY